MKKLKKGSRTLFELLIKKKSREILDQLAHNQVLVIKDWAMKWLP